jgi:hypothetical protein
MSGKPGTQDERVEDAADRAEEAVDAVKDKLADPIRKDG